MFNESLNGTQRWPLYTFLLKMFNTRLPITLERNALSLQNVQIVILVSVFHVCIKGTLSRGRMRQFLESKLEKFSLNFSSCSVNFKMASTSGGGHGGKLINS